jgi:uncharacterized glyoxalase superfamily protein PhnB
MSTPLNASKESKPHEQSVFTYLRTHDAPAAIEFYRAAFGAVEIFRLTEPSGRVGHAEINIDGTVVMVSDEYPEYGIRGPLAFGGTGVGVHLHVTNADATTQRAVAAGATLLMPPTDQFYGERSARLRDPFGHEWLVGHQIEAVSHEEMQRRYTALFADS